MDQHKKNNDDVDDLQNLLIKYSPNSNKLSYFEIFLNQMSLFQKDLKIHAEIEENVLMGKIYNNLKAFELKNV
jgi:iron-sulfur cluster repair protein YtfE (RIC family)